MNKGVTLLGLDPGLRRTGWGVIVVEGSALRYGAAGVVCSDDSMPLARRLAQLHDGIMAVIAHHQPQEAAVEETFVNVNPLSTLKLGQARGVVLLAPARAGLSVSEYTPNLVKKAIVGTGHASKSQVAMMVERLLPGCRLDPVIDATDATDALAVAICHAHHRALPSRIAAFPEKDGRHRRAGGKIRP
ncbi:MAG: crossover junction endodeoxyribonuclease RuvC [Rhodospirillaceae bacterium]|nr:MAG: crossover junction endodeoxyribonuclease RuvC [Rhodospirillaceae bacterium]